ncbi:uncharacterized protein LOC115422819 isoform X2 [Sphaeramia orbicularis]|uniref:uncharacterized protein LOC115422819 isoform X2 n=1 Tax=Sphaeramia orbicularis TaxID=375764 RepID=UPI00117D34B0|nr:uncharacterized protein LOC115422819 isoform X2 [Sphaeramia orbicularis]
MNIQPLVIFCFLSALCDENTRFVGANVFIQTEGESITVSCSFAFSGRMKYLCRDECNTILIQTTDHRAEHGRYSITYEEGTFPMSYTHVFVTISQLTEWDSGEYMCGLKRPYFPDSQQHFEIRVLDALVTEHQQTEPTTASPAGDKVKVSLSGHVISLVVYVTAVVFSAVLVFLVYKWKTKWISDGLNTRGQSEDRNSSQMCNIKLSCTKTSQKQRR